MPQTGKTPKKQQSDVETKYRGMSSDLRAGKKDAQLERKGLNDPRAGFMKRRYLELESAERRQAQQEGRMSFAKENQPRGVSRKELVRQWLETQKPGYEGMLTRNPRTPVENYVARKGYLAGQRPEVLTDALKKRMGYDPTDPYYGGVTTPVMRNRPRGKTVTGMMGAAGFGLGQMLREKMMKEQPSKKR